MDSKWRLFAALVLIIAALTGTVSALDRKAATINFCEDGGKTKRLSSNARTVSGLLDEHKIGIEEFDTITPSLDEPIEQDMEIELIRGVTVNVIFDGVETRKKPVQSPKVSMEEFARFYSQQTGMEYEFDEELKDEVISNGEDINLKTKKCVTFTTTAEIPFETVVIKSSELHKGTEATLIEGIKGEQVSVVKVNYVSDVEVSREVLRVVSEKPAIDEKIMIGTADIGLTQLQLEAEVARLEEERISAARRDAEKEESKRQEAAKKDAERKLAERAEAERKAAAEQPAQTRTASVEAPATAVESAGTISGYEYSKMIVMSATAYTADYASTGKNPGDAYFGITASGTTARVGAVAVDPKVIPLGTALYIEGYGYATAEDTGGAIKGNKVDLFFDTAWEVDVFGRQQLKVYVLE